jgi:hypothetical protein
MPIDIGSLGCFEHSERMIRAYRMADVCN